MKGLQWMTKAFGLYAWIIILAGCTLAPHYNQPAAPVPAAWPSGPSYQEQAGAESGQAPADLPWREFFVDPQLRELIESALENNRDLRAAALNIERTRQLYRIRRADLLPRVDATASGSRQRIPKDLSGTGSAMTVDQYSVGLGVSSYELDLFGRVRSLKEQALEQYLATREARRTVQIGLIAGVAAGYLTLGSDRELLQLAQDTLAAQEATYDMIRHRFEVGVSSELDLRQAQTRVEAARVDIARYTTLVAQDENGLVLLVGAPLKPDLLPTRLIESPLAGQKINAGLTSEVLLRRPDVRQAEETLKGNNANIGAARAAFFPQIILVGSVGTGSDQLSGLFGSGSQAWNFAPRLTLPIFTYGANQANLKVAKVDRDLAVAAYEKAIQTAFREVADALAQRGTIEAQMEAQQALAEAAAASYNLSRARFEKGVDNYLTVLDSQRALYGAQQGVIGTNLTRLQNLVTLYKVLGGGGEPAGNSAGNTTDSKEGS